MEITFTVSRTIKTSYRLKKLWTKRSSCRIRKEAFELFETLLFKVKADTIKFLMNLKVVVKEEQVTRKTPITKKQKISRNDPCSCGSGKKYKHCHGKVA